MAEMENTAAEELDPVSGETEEVTADTQDEETAAETEQTAETGEPEQKESDGEAQKGLFNKKKEKIRIKD